MTTPTEFEKIRQLSGSALAELIEYYAQSDTAELFAAANVLREKHYGKKVYFRGLVEFSSYCKTTATTAAYGAATIKLSATG